ncbi:MAG: hypothetical protein R3C19_00650 [Planctomycetaceae bacterium]
MNQLRIAVGLSIVVFATSWVAGGLVNCVDGCNSNWQAYVINDKCYVWTPESCREGSDMFAEGDEGGECELIVPIEEVTAYSCDAGSCSRICANPEIPPNLYQYQGAPVMGCHAIPKKFNRKQCSGM